MGDSRFCTVESDGVVCGEKFEGRGNVCPDCVKALRRMRNREQGEATLGATLTRTIQCSVCGRDRHVCVADSSESACAATMRFEEQHGVCSHCEDDGYEAEVPEAKPIWWRHCKPCGKQIHPGAWADHQRDHALRRTESAWAKGEEVRLSQDWNVPVKPSAKQPVYRYKQDF